jgi:hypothetical protein
MRPTCTQPALVRVATRLLRSRAIRRRLALGASLLVASLGVVGVAAGCGGGASGIQKVAGAASGAQSHETRHADSRPPKFTYLRLSKCTGSTNLRIRNLSCAKAKRKSGVLASNFFAHRLRHSGAYRVYRSRNYRRAKGWTCWGQLFRRNGPYQYVCWQRDEVMVFENGG